MININELYDHTPLWQMSAQERMGVMYMINKLPTKNVAIEIGSYCGGFLKYLAKQFKTVYSLDIDFSRLDKSEYDNVVWIQGDSKETLPKLVEQFNERNESVNFVMIDGDHNYDAVLQDVNNTLKFNVTSDMIIMAHDSWYGPSRDAISNANWSGNLHVHKIEKDLVCGDVIPYQAGNIYVGGLMAAILSPEVREGELAIGQTHDYMYTTVTGLL
jgi:precorrin-6B methylase 2